MAINDKPAVAGGTPAKTTPFTRAKRYGDEELQQLKEALDQQTFFYSQGNKVHTLEAEWAQRNGVPYAVCTSSGTASLHAAMIAIGVSPNDEVITSPITDMGSLVPILFQGGVPIFADLHPTSYVMTPESIEARITPRTKAVLAVHLWGNACDLDGISEICKKHNVTLIEDCAQAFGCTYKGKPIGTIGEVGCFSFNEFKHISCGDGGITITKTEELADRLRLSTDKGYSRKTGVAVRDPKFLAANYRITELQAAVALAQVPKLDSIVSRRRKWCEALTRKLQGIEGITLPEPTPGCNPSWWFYMMRVQPEILGATADEFAQAMGEEGIGLGVHYIGRPIYEYPIFINHSAFERESHPFERVTYGKGMCPEAERILETCVMLGINEGYTEQDLEETAEGLLKVARWFKNGKK